MQDIFGMANVLEFVDFNFISRTLNGGESA